jgi:hypothetical protein
VNAKHVNAFGVNEKTFTAKTFTTPPATQTKPGLLSHQSFNHKNHPADNAVHHRLLPTKKARQLPWVVFLLTSLR